MSETLDFLNKNSGALSAVFSAVVTFATVIYAWLTAKLVSETKQMRQAQTEPRLQVTYLVRDEYINFIDFSIKNIGLGPAYDIKLVIKDHSHSSGALTLRNALLELSCIKNGLAYLGPNQEFKTFWESLTEGDASTIKSRFTISCSYRSVSGIKYSHDCIVDLSELEGNSQLGEPPLYKIAKHIEVIERNVSHLTTGISRIKVDTFTESDRAAEKVALQERIQRERDKHSPKS